MTTTVDSGTNDGMAEIKRRVTVWRAEHDLTLRDLAAQLGESEQWLSHKLNGARKWQPDELIRVARAVGQDPGEWLGLIWPSVGEVVAEAAGQGKKPTKVRRITRPQ